MAKVSRLSAIAVIGLCVSPLLGARVALAGDDAKMSIKIQTEEGAKIELETSAGWLQGLVDSADVECEADEDRDTRRMMASLERQGEGGVYRGVDGDGDFVARRRGGMLRIEKAKDAGDTTLVEMPWEVAQCLMSGIEPAGDLGRRLARGEARLRFETRKGGASVSLRLE